MRVLWFSNTPANGAAALGDGIVGGGWLESLDLAIQDEVELHVAFYYPKRDTPFRHLNAAYYPIAWKNWKLRIIRDAFFERVTDEEDLNVYLDIIGRVKPDIIHIHGTENPFGCLIGKVDIPCVVSIQGNITVYHHKYFSGIGREVAAYRPKSANLKKTLLTKTFRQTYGTFGRMKARELKNFRSTRYVIGRTDWDRRISSVLAPGAAYFRGEEMLRDVFYQHQWTPRAQTGKLIIHTTNGNSPYKGLETLCEALHELNKLGIPVEWRVAGVGENDAITGAVKRELKDRFPRKGLALLGSQTAGQLVHKLLEADVYVMPSHIENSPNNLCEAMLLGMPCIATFAGGTGSMMADGAEGILIQDGDPWAMAGAILELHRDPEKARALGQQARARALVRHDKERIVAEQLAIYRQVLEKEKRPARKAAVS